MARINQRPSETPTARSSNLPAAPSVAPSSPNLSSDKENHSTSAPRDKGKGRMSGPSDSHSAKRRRIQPRSTASVANHEENDDSRFYDPTQDQHERQEIKKKSRALEREFNENKDVYLKDGTQLESIIDRANEVYGRVKQTADATVDSRLLVNISDMALKASAQLTLGDNSTGVDIDEFVSKCILFMKNDTGNASATSTQRRRQRQSHRGDGDDDDEDENPTDVLDWAHLGSHACFPYNLRPPAPSFLLGPLSVQKKVRAQTQRRARQRKDSTIKEVRPEALTERDLQTNESNALTTLCQNIKKILETHCTTATAAIDSLGDLDDDQILTEMKRNRIAPTGGPSLFDFAINPHSFGQTVENIFYISFLIKEGNVGLQMDDDGLPTLLSAEPQTVAQQREKSSMRHQAVFSIDYSTWQRLIQAFKITEPLIPHRGTSGGGPAIGARGWYNG
ncbi:hypothetical protein D6C86_00864 [Aureobasidium pullulans]|uniref:Non-structural maintenance of chromosomes element 4 n=1 Tax=Aureobasidium pullulans TaxID=5580 RepID=A0A4S9WMM6_AURPU|nr:hypothetical protein D6D22_01162 [Aureobasidium pullulans]THY67366.1 hypothetical protein D6C97_00886 [Aureobasidium pullulans]THY77110.1 hypothetical protein D6C94_02459 [Aureobasidium pullulans]THZ47426.1 hypothetical protein D6C87_01463 [Aureobasidium pullulans]THZ66817.1 hypothetical protein D6C86_00864 [Aureobasidium pullulans]